MTAITVDLDKGVVVSADAEAEQRFGEIIRQPIGSFLPQVVTDVPSEGVFWWRHKDQTRSYERWLCAHYPDHPRRALLALRPEQQKTLDAAVAPVFMTALEDIDRGASFDSALATIVGAIRSVLDLPLVRALVLKDTKLHELVVAGNPLIATATRLGIHNLEVTGDVLGPAKAARQGHAYISRLDPGANDSWSCALRSQGIHAIGWWPLMTTSELMIIELSAEGAGDFDESLTAGFLAQWMPWLEAQLTVRDAIDEQRLAAESLSGAATPAFITDTAGVIVWINRAFTRVYGHDREAAIGATPRILQSGEHGQRYYQNLWSTLRSGRSWSGETIDRTEDGRPVTVRQTITPVRHGNHITHYLSIQTDVSADADARMVDERQRGTDALTGLLTRATFEERGRAMLISTEAEHQRVIFLLGTLRTASGLMPELEAETMAHVRGVFGKRIRHVLPTGAPIGTYGRFDFAAVLPTGADILKLGSQLHEALEAPIPLLGDTLGLRCHTAFVEYPAAGSTIRDLHHAADRILAKSEPNPAIENHRVVVLE